VWHVVVLVVEVIKLLNLRRLLRCWRTKTFSMMLRLSIGTEYS